MPANVSCCIVVRITISPQGKAVRLTRKSTGRRVQIRFWFQSCQYVLAA